MISLNLPSRAVPDRVSVTRPLEVGRSTYAELDGPGCIKHIWTTTRAGDHTNRRIIIRIYFDNETLPYVEAPLGDFFGVMHGLAWYPVNTPYLSVKAQSGYNAYFPMPFARSARIEFEAASEYPLYLMVDWHRYPDQQMEESRRFCARWRRETPTQRYADEFLMLDADGPGQLVGFAYGVRLFDNVDRWSHGGADNIYVDGQGDHPAYLRGIGGEDTFGTSYGGALHPPETHLHAGIPYYVHEDIGEARPAQRLVGYRFFDPDTITFEESLQLRFGCMQNDICSTTYWYQSNPVRPFFRMPEWAHLLPGERHGPPLGQIPAGTYDLDLPESGSWWLCGPFAYEGAMSRTIEAETTFQPMDTFDGSHESDSPWLEEGSREVSRHEARWMRRAANHGFIDFNHVFRPAARGAGKTHPGAAIARCQLDAPGDTNADLRLAWDDHLILRVNDDDPIDLGTHTAFRAKTVQVPLTSDANTLSLKLSNTKGSNHGGWAFAFRATTSDGNVLHPRAE